MCSTMINGFGTHGQNIVALLVLLTTPLDPPFAGPMCLGRYGWSQGYVTSCGGIHAARNWAGVIFRNPGDV